jgi:hypothetical protein
MISLNAKSLLQFREETPAISVKLKNDQQEGLALTLLLITV